MSVCLTTVHALSGVLRNPVELPETETTELKLLSVQVLEEGDVLERCVVAAKHFAPITFFAERGLVGGHVYQPTVNHRIMNFANLAAKRTVEDDVVVTPLLRSMIYNEGKSSFSGNTTMRLFCYEIVPEEQARKSCPSLMSPAPLAFELDIAADDPEEEEEVEETGSAGSEGEAPEVNAKVVLSPTGETKGNKTSISSTSTLSSSGTAANHNAHVPASVVVRSEEGKSEAIPDDEGIRNCPVPKKEPLSRMMLMGSIEATKGRSLRGETFDRLLEVFGMHRKQKGNPTVTPVELASFLHTISQDNVSTTEELKAYTEKFKLTRFYRTDTKPTHQQLKTLGVILRMLVTFRLAAYDGRHRFNLCCYYATGMFLPTSDLRPKVVSFDAVKNMFSEKGDKKATFETTQLFLKQEFSIAMDKADSKSWAVVSETMKSFGQETQRLQELTVKMTCPSVLTEFVNEFEASELFINTEPLGSVFWTTPIPPKSHLKLPYSAHFKSFQKFLNDSLITRGPIFKGNSHLEWKGIFNECRKLGTNLKYPLGNSIETKPPNGLSKNLGITVTLLKFLGPDPRNYNELRKFTNQNQWEKVQNPLLEEDMERLKSLGFMKQAILDNVIATATHCTQKYVMEKKVMEWARNECDNPDLAADLKESYPYFPRCEKTDLNFEWIKGRVINDKEMLLSSSKMTNKLFFALVSTLMSDAISTYNKSGPNPVFPHQTSCNKAMDLYLK